ncbi:MAG: Holliday junction branch migration protein RuvA [Acidimicrobiales bacterium]|nr:Holliday junction branch migration protein RuvA [Acidimicrobiales bacterium]
MIGSVRGVLLDRAEQELLVEVSGLGYRVVVSPSTAVSFGEIGREVFLHVHHHVREDADTLFGFPSIDERRCFEALIGAHGVGPSLAMAILSVHDPVGLRTILVTDDVAALCLVPGVGKKTAARLLVELKSRLGVDGDIDLASLGAARAPLPAATPALTDVRDALLGLGYGPDEVQRALTDLPHEGDAGLLLKQALRTLASA